jgi:TfoX/Sxy family transcriptional regulator of competence genes
MIGAQEAREAMAYNEKLGDRMRLALQGRPGVAEKHMFGGIAFLLNGSMFCGIVKDDLMVRVGPEQHDVAVAEPHARPMDFTGRPMKGYVFVALDGLKTEKALVRWLDRGAAFVATLPPKKVKTKA